MLSYEQHLAPYGSPTAAPTGASTGPSGLPSASRPSLSSTVTTDGTASLREPRHMWIIIGAAGCGKSTVAQHLAQNLSLPYIEGDKVCAINSPGVISAKSHSSIRRQISRRWLPVYLSRTPIDGTGSSCFGSNLFLSCRTAHLALSSRAVP